MKTRTLSLLSAVVWGCLSLPATAQTLPGTAIGLPGNGSAPPSAANAPILGPMDASEQSTGYFTAGAGVYFVMPYFTSNPAYITYNSSKTPTTEHQTDFSQHIVAAPLVWLGYTFDNGWGIRGRWFGISADGHANTTADGVSAYDTPGYSVSSGTFTTLGSPVTATSTLNVNAFDIEATYNWVFGRWAILGSAGVRYAHIAQTYEFSVNDPINGITSAAGSNSFNGAGPTMCVELRRQICDTCFFLYGSARGSILFGSSHQTSSSVTPGSEEEVVPAQVPSLGPVQSANQTIVLPVGELEIGGEWARTVGRVRVFANLAFVGQVWWGVGNASQTMPLYYDGITSFGSNLGFIGGLARAGISF